MASTPAVTTQTFEREVLASDLPVVVDIWSVTCPPCRTIGSIIDKLAAEYAGKAKVFKLDIVDNPEVAGRYRVSAVPTLLYFQSGQVVKMIVGAQPEQKIRAALDALV